ncbi:MAG: hypothetical protein WA771_06460, partial [Chthoniobacterales bacterium]
MRMRFSVALVFATITLASVGCSRFNSTGGVVSPANTIQPAAPVAFPVTLAAQPAVPYRAWAARIPEAVLPSARFTVPGGERITIDIYASDYGGRTPSPNVRASYVLKNGGTVRLSDTSQGVAPTPGHYLAKIV